MNRFNLYIKLIQKVEPSTAEKVYRQLKICIYEAAREALGKIEGNNPKAKSWWTDNL